MRIVCSLFCFLVGLSGYGQSRSVSTTKTDLFVGVWEMVSVVNSNTNGSRMRSGGGNLKIFGADGSYLFVQVTPVGSVIAQQGTFSVLSDSTYAEYVETAFNQGLNGLSSQIGYTLDSVGHVLRIQGKVNDFVFDEEWRKVQIPLSRNDTTNQTQP